VDDALEDARATKDLVAELPDADAKPLYRASAELYVQHVHVLDAAIDIEPDDLRDQTVLLARRLRELGDRVFDRGHALVDPEFGSDRPDVTVNLPEEVPDWEAEGLAAGPPLDEEPGPRASTPPLRADERPTQDADGWREAVEDAGAPNDIDVDASDDALAKAASRYIAAAEQLRDEPDPDVPRGREVSALLRLGYLIKADAARAAQIGLDNVAMSLDGIDLGTDGALAN
jgi:hypothetical protein